MLSGLKCVHHATVCGIQSLTLSRWRSNHIENCPLIRSAYNRDLHHERDTKKLLTFLIEDLQLMRSFLLAPFQNQTVEVSAR